VECFTRRTLLQRGIAATPLLLAGATPVSAVARSRRRRPRGALPTAADVRREVREMVQLGPRLTATSPHLQFIDALEEGFRGAGLTVTRDPQPFQQWLAQDFSLDVLSGAGAGRVPVASYYTYSGRTGPQGVTGDLVYAGPLPPPPSSPGALQAYADALPAAADALLAAVPGGVAGNIVLMEAPIAPLVSGSFDPLLTYRYDPDHTISETGDYKRAWTTLASLPRLEPFKAAGAAGVVFALDASPANARGQYTPFIWGYQDMPALIVDRPTGARLRTLAAGRPKTRMVLTATLTKTKSDSLVAVLPGSGATDEVLVVNTHTDGQNAFEENAGIACVALARHFAARSRSSRNRTLVFSAVTGHFSGGGQPQTQGFIDDHPDLIARTAAAVTLEHFGAQEWNDDANGYHYTGQVEIGAIFHSQTPIFQPAIDSLQATDLRRSELLRPAAVTFFGVGASLHQKGVPSVAFIAGPNYLLALDGEHGHIGKLDARRFAREIRWTADLVKRLDRIPAAQLAAGDSALLRPGVAT
jgi:hypothetical protein